MPNINYIDISDNIKTGDISTIFPDWSGSSEKVCIMSPHDDDALIGAGYAICSALQNGAEVFVFIFCSGNAGYSKPEQKDEIVRIRETETQNAYNRLGIKKENIIRFGYSDFSVLQNIGWRLNNGKDGSFKEVLTKLREFKITRVLAPNHYREHIDHLAVNLIGSFDSPQSGDPILVDWCEPNIVKSVLEYSVWADLSPEDALVNGRDKDLRANRIILVPQEVEKVVCQGIAEYKSQGEIIKGLIDSRVERRTKNGSYLEVYISFDPRPKIDFSPYIRYMEKLEK